MIVSSARWVAILRGGLCIVALLFSWGIWASSVPSVAEIGQINRMEEAAHRDIPRGTAVLPGGSVSTSIPASVRNTTVRFLLNQLIIEGAQTFSHNLVYSYATLYPLFKSYLGTVISLSDLDTIAAAITQYYRKNGYILVKAVVPPQRIRSEGIARIEVVEGFISDVEIRGTLPLGIRKKLMQFGEALKKVRPLTIRALERYALLANDLPGVTARVLLSADNKVAGHTRLTFVVRHRAFSTRSTLNNRGTRYLGPVQFSQQIINPGFLELPNLSQARLLLSQAGEELRFLELSTRQFFGDAGLESWLTVSLNETRPGFDLASLNIEGHSKHILWRLHYPWVRRRRFNMYLGAGLDAYDSTTYLDNVLFSDDQIRSIMLYADLSGSDHWRGRGRVRAEVWKGLGFLGADERGADNLTRAQGRPNYLKFVLDMERTQAIGHYGSVLVSVRGQYALNALLSSNQMGLGGGHDLVVLMIHQRLWVMKE